MNRSTILILVILTTILIKCINTFVPKKSGSIYSLVIAHRGLHIFSPENTLGAYYAAVKANMAIELDVRLTRDKELVCFHDRYTKRLLGVPGKLSLLTLDELKKYRVLQSEESVPTLLDALECINGGVLLLVEVKGNYTKDYQRRSIDICNKYNGKIYFHTKNLLTYYRLKKNFEQDRREKKVFLVCDIFRKRFNFVKGKDYKTQVKKYNELSSNVDIEIPSIEDISNTIVKAIEELEDKKEILASIGEVINKYETRVKLTDKSHWVNSSLWLHRGILSSKNKEHSLDGFIKCRDYAKKNNLNITVEFDVMLYKGEVRCYHQDKISSFFGQSKSCAEKIKLANSLRLMDVLNVFKGCNNINLAIDIKDYRIKNRVLEDLIVLDIEKSGYLGNFIMMSYNPFVLSYLKKVRPDYLRAQIGHSLKGLRKVPILRFPALLNGVLGMLFDLSCADVVVFDDSHWIFYLISYHKNIKGKPVLIYAPKSYTEMEAFVGKESVSNFIVENVADVNSWPKEYIKRFKI